MSILFFIQDTFFEIPYDNFQNIKCINYIVSDINEINQVFDFNIYYIYANITSKNMFYDMNFSKYLLVFNIFQYMLATSIILHIDLYYLITYL